MMSATLVFPGERLATFVCSFGAADVSTYRLVGTRGDLAVENAYEISSSITHVQTIQDKRKERKFGKRDQFAAELIYFSDCILEDREPEPSGVEGMADVRVINALYRSAEDNVPVFLSDFEKEMRPTPDQEITRPSIKEPALYHAQPPSLDQ